MTLERSVEAGDTGRVKKIFAKKGHKLRIKDSQLFFITPPRNIEMAKVLLDNGVDPDLANEKGDTAVHRAVYYGDLKMMELLIKRHANLNKKNNEGVTPLMMAVKKGRLPFVTLLTRAGADGLFLHDNTGKTALDYSQSGRITQQITASPFAFTTGEIGHLDQKSYIIRGIRNLKGKNYLTAANFFEKAAVDLADKNMVLAVFHGLQSGVLYYSIDRTYDGYRTFKNAQLHLSKLFLGYHLSFVKKKISQKQLIQNINYFYRLKFLKTRTSIVNQSIKEAIKLANDTASYYQNMLTKAKKDKSISQAKQNMYLILSKQYKRTHVKLVEMLNKIIKNQKKCQCTGQKLI